MEKLKSQNYTDQTKTSINKDGRLRKCFFPGIVAAYLEDQGDFDLIFFG